MKTEFPVGALIREDHREMRRLFTELENRQSRPLAAPMLLTLLAAHSRAEESEVYPALRRHAGAADVVAHSQHEHAEADRLVEQLAQEDLDDDDFDRTLKSLVDAVNHHIEEEEESVLTEAGKLPLAKQHALGAAFAATRSAMLTSLSDPLTRRQLEQQGRNEGISGIRSMSRSELTDAVTADPS